MSVLLQQTQVTLIQKGSYTQGQTSGNQQNTNGHGVKIYTYVYDASGAGSITVQILGVDLTSGQTFIILASVALVAIGLNILTIFPGLVAVANQVANDCLPLNWQVNVIANNANPLTYSISCDIIS